MAPFSSFRNLFIAALLIAGVGCASLFPRKWQRFTARNGSFAVDFPAGNVQAVRGQGRLLYRLAAGRVVYAASTFDADVKNPSPAYVDGAFAGFPPGLAKSMGGKVTSVSRAVELNLNGVSSHIKTPQGACDVRLYNKAARFYFLVVCYPDGEKDRATFAHFFESLSVLE